MIPAYLFDIDGTLADCSHRLHHIKGEKKDWEAFYDGCPDDEPIMAVLHVAQALQRDRGRSPGTANGAEIVFMTGRSERCRKDTRTWLLWWGLRPISLYMRADGDHRTDDVVKKEMLDRVRADGFAPILAFEDRTRVVEMFRANGVPCAQVAPGDY
jgi:phosphoglycolate phosphatase-like HAD superfamily hydrolase